MKHTVISCSTIRQPMYPGAADERYFAEKALEILAAVLSGTGALALMLLLCIASLASQSYNPFIYFRF